jgi:hypothetical protein
MENTTYSPYEKKENKYRGSTKKRYAELYYYPKEVTMEKYYTIPTSDGAEIR